MQRKVKNYLDLVFIPMFPSVLVLLHTARPNCITAEIYLLQHVYVATSRQLKRLESVSRSPIYSHFGETITGASTIRAYDKEKQFILESEQKVDENQVCFYPSVIANRFVWARDLTKTLEWLQRKLSNYPPDCAFQMVGNTIGIRWYSHGLLCIPICCSWEGFPQCWSGWPLSQLCNVGQCTL